MLRWRASMFGLLQRVARGLDASSRALACVAIAILRREQLEAAVGKRWENFGASERHVLSGLMPWEQTFYRRFLKPADEILVVGCGTGRDLIALLRAGYRAEGLEVAPRAAAFARQMLEKQGLAVSVAVGAAECAAFAKRFDACIFSWFCYSYIPLRATRIAALKNASAHLRPGGRILISYIQCANLDRRCLLALTRAAARLARSAWQPAATDVIELGNGGVHYEHEFQPAEIEDEAQAAGLRVVFHETTNEGLAVLTAQG